MRFKEVHNIMKQAKVCLTPVTTAEIKISRPGRESIHEENLHCALKYDYHYTDFVRHIYSQTMA